MHRGVPIDVTGNPFKAEEIARERSVVGAKATVLAVVPAQLELDFGDEEPTDAG